MPPAPSTLKLLSVTLPVDKPPSMRMTRTIDCAMPVDDHIGWSIKVRGPAVILVSPPAVNTGARRMFEFARTACSLIWSSTDIDDVDRVQKHDTPPLSRPDVVPEAIGPEGER